MKIWTKFNPDTGEVLGWSSGDPVCPGDDYIATPEGPGHPNTHYVKNGVLCTYTQQEQEQLRNLPAGLVWDVKSRKPKDLRSEEQKAEDEAKLVISNRVAAYPPLTELADALYWQSQGDETKMEAYLTKCGEVKARYPKT